MIVTRKLLSQFLNLNNISNQKIADDLTELGFETKIARDLTAFNQGIKMAKIIELQTHPQLQKLKIVKIDDGLAKYPVVCGADNFQLNDYVIWAPPQSILFNNFKIKKRKFIDIVSEGMLCSWTELGIPEKENNGIIAIPPDNPLFAKIQTEKKHPLEYLGFDDTIFDVDILPGNSEHANVYSLARYLSGLWKSSLNSYKPSSKSFTQKQIISPQVSNKSNKIDVYLSFSFPPNCSIPLWLNNFENNYQKKFTDAREGLIDYLEILYGIKLQIKSLNNSAQNFSPKATTDIFNPALAMTIIKANNLQADELPPADNYQLAIEHLICILKKEFLIKNITYWKHILQPRQPDKLIVSLTFLEKILGVFWKITDLKEMLHPLGFVLNVLSKDQIEVFAPNNQKIANVQDFAEEIIRMYKISSLPELPFSSNKIMNKKNDDLYFLNQLRNYLIAQGLKEIKTSFNINNEKNDSSISNEQNIRNSLPKTLIPQLVNISKQENIFTLDTVFIPQNKTLEEKQYLAIVWSAPFLFATDKNTLTQANRAYLIAFLKNILKLWNIPSKNLMQKHGHLETSDQFSTFVLSKQLFSASGVDEIYYENSFLSKIGVINQLKKEKIISNFYLELDISNLLKIVSNRSEMKFHSRSSDKLIYYDFSLRYAHPLPSQVILKTPNQIQFRHSLYNLLYSQLKALDKNIVKLELIDIYQNQVLTWRFWKFIKPDEEKHKSDWFSDLNKKITNLKNAKIV